MTTERVSSILNEIEGLESKREVLRISARKIHEQLNVISYTLNSLRRDLTEVDV